MSDEIHGTKLDGGWFDEASSFNRVECSVAHVTIVAEGQTVELDAPAYTRTPMDFMTQLLAAYDSYVASSLISGMGLSLADFAFLLLSRASQEPRVQS